MVWLIEVIDRNQKMYGVVLTAVYAALLLYSWIDYELLVQGSIFFLLPIILYSFGTIKSLYTKEKQSEQIIERSKAQYQKVVDNIKEGMIIIDPAAKISFMNKAGAD